MGIFSTILAYQFGRRRGKKQNDSERESPHEGHPDCLNYSSFCHHFGSCDGQECEFDDD